MSESAFYRVGCATTSPLGIPAEVEAAPLAPHVVHALEESAARYAAEPNEGSPWPEARARVLARRSKG